MAKITLKEKMGMGFEARAVHPCPTQIWVPPRDSHSYFNCLAVLSSHIGTEFLRPTLLVRGIWTCTLWSTPHRHRLVYPLVEKDFWITLVKSQPYYWITEVLIYQQQHIQSKKVYACVLHTRISKWQAYVYRQPSNMTLLGFHLVQVFYFFENLGAKQAYFLV